MRVSPLPFDPILPTQYLDFDTLKEHKILMGRADNFTYNLLFNQSHVVDTYLPASALFDYHNKERYFVLESEARAHNVAVAAARGIHTKSLRELPCRLLPSRLLIYYQVRPKA